MSYEISHALCLLSLAISNKQKVSRNDLKLYVSLMPADWRSAFAIALCKNSTSVHLCQCSGIHFTAGRCFLLRPFKLRLHIAISMHTRLQTGLQTGVSGVYTGRLVCKPVCQPVVVTFTQGDWFAYRYAYRFCKPSHCLRIWPRPLASLVTQCLRRRNRPGK